MKTLYGWKGTEIVGSKLPKRNAAAEPSVALDVGP